MHHKELGEGRRQRAKRVLNWAIVHQLKTAKINEMKRALQAQSWVGLSSSPLSPRVFELLEEEVCTILQCLPCLPCLLLCTC